MTTFIIAPTDHAANTAVSAVRKSLESRPYLHFILVRGKQQGKGIAFSHIDITTDVNKAAELGYMTPYDWLEVFKNPMKYKIEEAKRLANDR